ncbi:hypothetical protein G7066_13025 [Leucobacter coleopterorum]|uniref:Htaa domain-containing protein n=1 Tax=Leucobacter coleopterorum TaxID=2714933 RepID=A0ABX6JY59_9MICO|nr:HtaA domain-containing protein [Leucobacter coleopterorum]QIM19255.1 hypothetical protein G7066_13025 [Leucobacter coleopterorum]
MNTIPNSQRTLLTRKFLRRGVLLVSALLATPLLLAPAAALAAPSASPAKAEGETNACQVTNGTLTWGVKESFRSYISGSIANGSWDTKDGATYTTPDFQWAEATGSVDPTTGTGSVSFVGTVHFTGHDGVLDLTLANPTIEFEGDGKASLLLDARSTDAAGKVTIDSKQEWVGDMTAPFPLAVEGEPLKFDSVKTVLTNSGAKAFAGFYEAGANLDPVTVSLDLAGCDLSKAVPGETTQTPATTEPATAVPVAETGSETPWLPIIIGGVALLVIGVTAGMLLSGRKRTRPAQDPAPQDPSPQEPAE